MFDLDYMMLDIYDDKQLEMTKQLMMLQLLNYPMLVNDKMYCLL
jgi:hypothetical protein